MRAAVFALLLAMACGGWSCTRVKPTAPPAAPPAMCFVPCTPSLIDTGVRWEANPTDAAAFDVLGEDVTPTLASKLLSCEAKRQACAGFILDLDKRGVIRMEK